MRSDRPSWPRPVCFVVVAVVYATACAPAPRRRAAPAVGPPSLHDTPAAATADVRHLRNARAYIQDNLWTHGDDQYGVWVDDRGNALVGKRRRSDGPRPDGRWSTFALSAIPGDPLALPTAADGHNVYAIAVDAAGFVHVAGNMHNDRLRYVRSTRPRDIRSWKQGRMIGTDESSVSYPAFVRRRDGGLLFFYREGSSGDGDVYANTYEDGRWRRLTKVIDGRATAESAYLSHVAVDRNDTIHLLFTWRGTSDAATSNDLSYARSRDGGRNWERSDGTGATSTITHANAEIVLDTPDEDSGLSSGGGLEVDDHGRPHGAVLLGSGAARTIRHVWFDGSWHDEDVEIPGVDAVRATVLTSGTAAFILVPTRDDIRLVDVTPGREPRDPLLLATVSVPGWETAIDTQALYDDRRLSALVPRRGRDGTIGLTTATMELADAA
jgi:hypothetical protein